jgi:small glutamine-rich tetratricopeptide repeat-containing protein alpha
MSNPEAEKSKELGNAAIQKKDFNEAVLQYTNAIKLDSTQAPYYTNRALALNNLGKHEDALKDAEKAIELAPTVMRVCSD